jgi:hypothetical protein
MACKEMSMRVSGRRGEHLGYSGVEAKPDATKESDAVSTAPSAQSQSLLSVVIDSLMYSVTQKANSTTPRASFRA